MKNKKYIILLTSMILSLGLYNLIVFLINSGAKANFNYSFWFSYAFITFGFIIFFVSQLIVTSKENAEKVTGMPINVLSLLYLFAELIMGTIFMFFPQMPLAVVLIPHAVLFVCFALIFVPATLTYYTKD